MSRAWRVAVVASAVVVITALNGAARAADVHEVDLEGMLAPRRALPRVAPPALSLVWVDAASAATGSERSAREEAQRLLRALGVAASWRSGKPSDPVRPGELRVILLDRRASDAGGSPVLGATPDRFDGDPFFWVHVPSVREALGLDPRRPVAPTELRDRHALGIAIGRVIAHEAVHALAPAVPHGVGLMAARLKRGDLLAKTLPVGGELGSAFRAALAVRDAVAADSGLAQGRLLAVGAEATRY